MRKYRCIRYYENSSNDSSLYENRGVRCCTLLETPACRILYSIDVFNLTKNCHGNEATHRADLQTSKSQSHGPLMTLKGRLKQRNQLRSARVSTSRSSEVILKTAEPLVLLQPTRKITHSKFFKESNPPLRPQTHPHHFFPRAGSPK